MIDPKALPPTVYSEEEGGLLREFLGFADFVTDNPPMQKREVSVRMIVAAAQALRDLTVENKRLKALGDGLAGLCDEARVFVSAIEHYEGQSHTWRWEQALALRRRMDDALAAWEKR